MKGILQEVDTIYWVIEGSPVRNNRVSLSGELKANPEEELMRGHRCEALTGSQGVASQSHCLPPQSSLHSNKLGGEGGRALLEEDDTLTPSTLLLILSGHTQGQMS